LMTETERSSIEWDKPKPVFKQKFD